MSTQPSFDPDGLSRAIESGDARYLDCLLRRRCRGALFDSDHPRQAPQTLRSSSAIAGWIEDMHSPGQAHRVVGSTADADSVALVEECTHADGGRGMWAYSAEVAGGQIIRATAMVTAAEAPPTRREETVSMVDTPFIPEDAETRSRACAFPRTYRSGGAWRHRLGPSGRVGPGSERRLGRCLGAKRQVPPPRVLLGR